MIGLHDDAPITEAESRALECFEEAASEGLIIRRANAGDSFFECAEDGEIEAAIIPVCDHGPAYDLIAWALNDPWRWWSFRGEATLLGRRALHRANFDNRPIRLVATPQAWVQGTVIAGPYEGPVCIVDWSNDPRLTLGMAVAVECADTRVRNRLADAIAAHSKPAFRIFTARPEARRAA